MDRRKAMAVAAAITMSLTSGVVALGANFGAFGFGAAHTASAKQSTVVATAPVAAPATQFTSSTRGEQDD